MVEAVGLLQQGFAPFLILFCLSCHSSWSWMLYLLDCSTHSSSLYVNCFWSIWRCNSVQCSAIHYAFACGWPQPADCVCSILPGNTCEVVFMNCFWVELETPAPWCLMQTSSPAALGLFYWVQVQVKLVKEAGWLFISFNLQKNKERFIAGGNIIVTFECSTICSVSLFAQLCSRTSVSCKAWMENACNCPREFIEGIILVSMIL